MTNSFTVLSNQLAAICIYHPSGQIYNLIENYTAYHALGGLEGEAEGWDMTDLWYIQINTTKLCSKI